MTDRDHLLADSMRLENVEPGANKLLWMVEGDTHIVVVEAVTPSGAAAVADQHGVLPAGHLKLGGPLPRAMVPESWLYRLMDEAEVDRIIGELGN